MDGRRARERRVASKVEVFFSSSSFLPSFFALLFIISARPCLLVDTGAAPHSFHARKGEVKEEEEGGGRRRREGELHLSRCRLCPPRLSPHPLSLSLLSLPLVVPRVGAAP